MCFVLCRTYCEESSRINRRGSRKQYVVLHHVTWFNVIEIEFIFHLWSDWSIVELVTCELIICLSDWLFIMHCLFFKSTKWKSKIAQDGLHSAHVSFWWHLWVHNRGSGDEHRRGAPEAALRTITIWLVQLRLLHRRVGHQLIKHHGGQLLHPDWVQMKGLAVRYQNPAVHVQEFLRLSQEQDEGVRHCPY